MTGQAWHSLDLLFQVHLAHFSYHSLYFCQPDIITIPFMILCTSCSSILFPILPHLSISYTFFKILLNVTSSTKALFSHPQQPRWLISTLSSHSTWYIELWYLFFNSCHSSGVKVVLSLSLQPQCLALYLAYIAVMRIRNGIWRKVYIAWMNELYKCKSCKGE